MPLPFIIGAAAVAIATGYGAKKGYDAYKDNEEAEDDYRDAQIKYEKSSKKSKMAKEFANEKFSDLGKLQCNIIQDENGLNRLREIALQYKQDIANVSQGQLDSTQLQQFDEIVRDLDKGLGDMKAAIGASVGAGAMAGLGAFGGVGLIGTASTGTAITSLTGVAATNATLAWFGGGSLATGGLGIAGGAAVLGGIVAAPAIAIAGAIFASRAKAKKEKADDYWWDIKNLCEAMDRESELWYIFGRKADEKSNALENTYRRFARAMANVESSMDKYKHPFGSNDDGRDFAESIRLARDMLTSVCSPIINDKDSDSKELTNLQKDIQQKLKNINRDYR